MARDVEGDIRSESSGIRIVETDGIESSSSSYGLLDCPLFKCSRLVELEERFSGTAAWPPTSAESETLTSRSTAGFEFECEDGCREGNTEESDSSGDEKEVCKGDKGVALGNTTGITWTCFSSLLCPQEEDWGGGCSGGTRGEEGRA